MKVRIKSICSDEPLITNTAHLIQNASNQLAQSCCALRAVNRWAITGTPIQNKLANFASIVSFLQIYPYCSQVVFDEDISKPWRRNDPIGFYRLKTLVRAITIARTKTVIDLPPRKDFIFRLDFTSEEMQLYDDTKKQTVGLLQELFSSPPAKARFNALQQLNTLRLICSHGLLAQSNRSTLKNSGLSTPCTYLPSKLDTAFDQGLLGETFGVTVTCMRCGVELVEDFMEDQFSADQPPCHNVHNNHQPLCGSCEFESVDSVLEPASSAHRLDLPRSPVSFELSPPSTEEDEELPLESLDSMPTKIKALVADLLQHGPNEKRWAASSQHHILCC